jgi:hypothetical protein
MASYRPVTAFPGGLCKDVARKSRNHNTIERVCRAGGVLRSMPLEAYPATERRAAATSTFVTLTAT